MSSRVWSGYLWFAVQVRCRHERLTASFLECKGYETFLPQYDAYLRPADCVSRTRPLFPGYLFCRFDPTISIPMVTTPGLIRILGNSSGPLPIDKDEISALKKIVESGYHREPYVYLQTGRLVRIFKGPLRGLEGIVVGENARRGLVVSISLLQRSVMVEIDRRWLQSI